MQPILNTASPTDFEDYDTAVVDGSGVGDYDDHLSGLGFQPNSNEPEPETKVEADKPEGAADTTTPGGGQQQQPGAVEDDGSPWDQPQAIPDWQTRAQNEQLPAGSEAEYRDLAQVRQVVQQKFNEDPAAQELYQLMADETPARTRIARYVANKIKEPYEQPNDPDLLERVRGQLTDYFDDDDQITPKGQKLDQHLKQQYQSQLNKRVGQYEQEGRQFVANTRQFIGALEDEIKSIEGLSKAEQRDLYRYVRGGGLLRIVDGVNEKGESLTPKEVAKQQAEAALWANPTTREVLLKKRDEQAGKKGQSEFIKNNL